MTSIQRLSEATRFSSLALHESETMNFLRIATESVRLASQAFREPEALATVRQFSESSSLADLALQESKATNIFRTIAESNRFHAFAAQQSEVTRQFQNFSLSSQLATNAIRQAKAFDQFSQLTSLTSVQMLAGLKNSPFSEIQSLAANFNSEFDSDEVSDESLLELDSQLANEVGAETDFNNLSDKTRQILLYLYHFYILPILIGCLLIANQDLIREKLELVKTPAEAKSFARALNANIDREALRYFRVTTANSLNLRETPSMQSDIITTLPVGSLIEVLDKSRRSWLLVEIELDGELEQGWVARRYTAYFK